MQSFLGRTATSLTAHEPTLTGCLVGLDNHFKLRSIGYFLLELQMSGFEHWLEEHGLGKYTELFVDNEIGLEVLTELEEAVVP